MKPIQIFVRHCHYSPCSSFPGRTRPSWYDPHKIFKNLLDTIDNELADLHVVFDNHFGPKPFWLEGVNCHIINAGTEGKSFLQLLDIVNQKNFTPDTIIYLLEGDYLHRQGFCQALIEGIDMQGASYVTLYDHEHMYNEPKPRYRISTLAYSKSCHWRTSIYTTNTFACKLKVLLTDIEVQRLYSTNTHDGATQDCAKWEYLHDTGCTLISAIPGFSTHVDGFLSPVIDWEQIIKNVKL